MRIVLVGQAQKDHACQVIQSMPDGKKVVTITDHKDIRSGAQNSLYWVWVTRLAGEWGMTKDEVHKMLKGKFLVRIYERDDPEGFGMSVQALRKLWKAGFKEDAQHLMDQIVDLTSTTSASVEQFTEYLDDIDKDALSKGVYLDRPEDTYREAMGLK